MLHSLILLGGFYFSLVKAGSLERISRDVSQENRLLGPLVGSTMGQLVNLPGLIPGPPGAPVVNLGGLRPQPNGGPLLNLAPLPLILPGVANICIDKAGQPLLGPACNAVPVTPGVPGVPTVPGGQGTPGLPGPGGPGGGATGPFADFINQIVQLILQLLRPGGPGGPGGVTQGPLLQFPPVPPAQLIPGIPGLLGFPGSSLPVLPGSGLPGLSIPEPMPEVPFPGIPVPEPLPQNPYYRYPIPPSSISEPLPEGLPFGQGIPGPSGRARDAYINVGAGGSGGLGQCGKKGVSRVLGGSEVGTLEYCWHATIFSRSVYKCSATIISATVVLTTAFCVVGRNPGDLSVRVGESYIGPSVSPGGQYLGIEQIYIHPNYNPNSGRYENNIAVIKLSKPIESSATTCAICLPSSPGDGSQYDNQRCTVTGFGSTTSAGGRNNNQLKAISLPVVPYSTCARILQKYVLNFQPHPSFLCAGGVYGQDACTGDGGGALACPGADGVTWKLAGITSWGAGCGKNGIPAVYTNIANSLSFIKGIVPTV